MKKLLTVTLFTGLLTLLKMAMGFVIAKVVAIYTGPAGMAMLGQIQSMVAAFNGIINAPVGSGIVRYTAEHNEQGFNACSPWWKASVQWVVILFAVIAPLGLIFSNQLSQWIFSSHEYTWLIIITIIALPFTALGSLINSVTNGLQQYRRYVALGMLATIISSAVMIYLIIVNNLNGALLAVSMQAGLIGIVMLVASLRQPWFKLQYWWGRSAAKERRAIGGYILMAVTTALATPISLVMVRNFLVAEVGWEQAGQWQAVWKISEVYLGVITMALGTYFLPKLSSLSGAEAILKEINNTIKIIMPIVILMALTVYFLRDIAISLLFTDAFRAARDLFAIQLIGDVVKIASWLYAFPMLSRGATKWFVFSEVFFALVFIVLSFFMIERYGVQGVNVAYLINYMMYFLFVFSNVKKIVR